MVTDWTSVRAVAELAREQERTLGASSAQLASTLARLADLYFVQEDYVNAESVYWRALSIFQKAVGESHADTAAVLQSLAELYEIQDRYAEAERFYKWATTARKNAKLRAHSDNMDKTMQGKALQPAPQLPDLSDLREKCDKCGRPLLDAQVCMYCTQSGFDAGAILRQAQASQLLSRDGEPMNTIVNLKDDSEVSADEEITIGRHPSNSIVLREDRHVSRQHAVIRCRFGQCTVEDRGTPNGTYVNSVRITGITRLHRGDLVTVGDTSLLCEFRLRQG